MAPATSARRRSQGATPRPRPGSTTSSQRHRLLWVAGAGVLLLAIYLLYRHQAAASAAPVTSGTPGPDLTGSQALAQPGGAASVPGNALGDNLLPTILDPLTGQVQTSDATSADTPTMVSSTSTTSIPWQISPDNPQGGVNAQTIGNQLAAINQAQASGATYTGPATNQQVAQYAASVNAQSAAIAARDAGRITGHGFVGD